MADYDGEENFLNLLSINTAEHIPFQILFRKNGQYIPTVVNPTRYLRQ